LILDILIEGRNKMTANGNELFLVHKRANNSLLVFASPTGLECLSKSSAWHADGTFFTASKYYYQLYVIQCWFANRMIPVAWALMTRRRQKDYITLIKALKRGSRRLNLTLDPKSIMTDFELGAMNAFKRQFPTIKVMGCMFHFGQSLMKKVNNLGLKGIYQEDPLFSSWIKQIFGLALVPVDEVRNLWNIIKEERPTVRRVDEIVDYFEGYYINGPFKIAIWNHFDTKGQPKTNNHLEGYNLKIKLAISVAHPDIYAAIKHFQDFELDASIEYFKAVSGAPGRPRRKRMVMKDDQFHTIKEMFLSNEITLDVYAKRCTSLMFIELKKKKARSVVGAEEEDEDDDEDSDEGEDEEQDEGEDEEQDEDDDDEDDDEDDEDDDEEQNNDEEDEDERNTIVNGDSTEQLQSTGCDCNSGCKTIRCVCKIAKKNCGEHCHPNNIKCQNK
jgi:hypothetical protein